MALYRRVGIDERTARALGFPIAYPGTAVTDPLGITWRVTTDSGGSGLSDLGFLWTALIPLGTSLLGGIFGLKSASKQAAAMKEQAAAQLQIEQLKLQEAQANAIPWNLVILGGAAVLIVMMMGR